MRDGIIAIIGNDTELQTADYNRFINEGKKMIEARILSERRDFFPDTETITLNLGDIDYTPTKTWENITLIQVDFGDGSGWRTLTKDSLEKVLGVNSTDPQGGFIFHLWGDVLYVPNWLKTGSIRIFGYVLPADLSGDGDTPLFSELLHPAIITWGIGRAVESSSASENFLDGQRKQLEFEKTLDTLLPQIILKDSTNVKSLV
jgi:hypothetical protein